MDGVPPAVGGIQVPPVGAHVAAQQPRDLGRDPRRHVHAVRHRTDWDLRLGQAAPRVLPQAARHRAMQPAHAHRLIGQAQRGVRRAQPLARIAGPLPAQVHEAVERDADLAEVRSELIPDQAGVEIIAARSDRRMGGEHDARARHESCLFERHLT